MKERILSILTNKRHEEAIRMKSGSTNFSWRGTSRREGLEVKKKAWLILGMGRWLVWLGTKRKRFMMNLEK